jgi:hypothetical protein
MEMPVYSVMPSARALGRRDTLLGRVGLAAGVGLIALAVAAPAQAAPPVHIKIQDGVLRVTGTPFSETLTARLAAGNPAVGEIDVDNDRQSDFSFTVADVAAIVIDGGRGFDRVSVDTSTGAFPADLPIVLFGGAGDDELFGGLGHQTLVGGSGDDTIDGNQGADDQFGGLGNDLIIWDPGDGSDLADGGAGFDTMLFNGSDLAEVFRAVQNNDRVTFTRDLGTIVMDLNDTERIDLHAARGNDALTVENISSTVLQQVDVDLASDEFADAVTVNGSAASDTFRIAADGGAVDISRSGAAAVRVSGADAGLDALTVDGKAGSDSFEVGQGVTNLLQLQTID